MGVREGKVRIENDCLTIELDGALIVLEQRVGSLLVGRARK